MRLLPAPNEGPNTIETFAPSSGRVGAKGRSVISVADTAEHSSGAIFEQYARNAQLARKMVYIERRLVETAPDRAAAMEAFNRGYNTKGAGAIIKMIGDEADLIFGVFGE